MPVMETTGLPGSLVNFHSRKSAPERSRNIAQIQSRARSFQFGGTCGCQVVVRVRGRTWGKRANLGAILGCADNSRIAVPGSQPSFVFESHGAAWYSRISTRPAAPVRQHIKRTAPAVRGHRLHNAARAGAVVLFRHNAPRERSKTHILRCGGRARADCQSA